MLADPLVMRELDALVADQWRYGMALRDDEHGERVPEQDIGFVAKIAVNPEFGSQLVERVAEPELLGNHASRRREISGRRCLFGPCIRGHGGDTGDSTCHSRSGAFEHAAATDRTPGLERSLLDIEHRLAPDFVSACRLKPAQRTQRFFPARLRPAFFFAAAASFSAAGFRPWICRTWASS